MGLMAASLWGFALYHGARDLFTVAEVPVLEAEAHGGQEPSGGADPLLVAGKKAYSNCALCHGNEGEGNVALNAPALNRLDAAYLQQQLLNFKEGRRGTHPEDPEGARMAPMAMMLPDEAAIHAVSVYIESLEAPMPPITIQADANAGKASYALCASCHGAEGEGNPALNAPALAGLQDWYVLSSLQKFKAGARGYDPEDTTGAQMRPMAMMIPDEVAMKNIVAYIAKLGVEAKE
jgi:cytochrome c553